MRLKLLVIFIITVTLASACNLGSTPPTQDVGAIQTQAMATVVAQFGGQLTQTAAAIPPTPLPTLALPPTATQGSIPTVALFTTPLGVTPFTFNTPAGSAIPTIAIGATVSTKNGCNDANYVGETAPYDGDKVKAGKNISKAWQLDNTGTCTWDEGYAFVFLPDVSSPEIKGYNIVIRKNSNDFTPPGYSQTFVVKLTAPTTSGEYKGYWKMRDDQGNYFGPRVYIDFIVP